MSLRVLAIKKLSIVLRSPVVQSAGAVEYTDGFSAEGQPLQQMFWIWTPLYFAWGFTPLEGIQSVYFKLC